MAGSIPFGMNPAGGRLGFRPEFGDLGKIVPGPGVQSIGLGRAGVALIGSRKARSATTSYPFDVTVSGSSDPRDVTLIPGVVNNLMPTNMFSTLSVDPTGTWYVVLTVTFAAAQVTSSLLSISATPPAASDVTEATPPASFDILLAVIVDATVFQIRHGNITVTPAEAFRTDRDSPANPGQLPYVSWWQWNLS